MTAACKLNFTIHIPREAFLDCDCDADAISAHPKSIVTDAATEAPPYSRLQDLHKKCSAPSCNSSHKFHNLKILVMDINDDTHSSLTYTAFFCSEECEMEIQNIVGRSFKAKSVSFVDPALPRPRIVNKICSLCYKKENLQRCAGCQCVHYCSKVCQKKHWPDHKMRCKKIQKMQTEFKD